MNNQPPYQPRDARDRPLIHNPNHQPPPHPPQQQQQPPYSYAPPPSQALHVPYGADPYAREQRRDPFLPHSTHQRNGSYGMPAGGPPMPGAPPERSHVDGSWSHNGAQGQHHASVQHHQHQSVGPPPPPPMSAPHHTQPSPAYAPDHSRRGSLGGASPPTSYYHQPRDVQPPPPPPANSRNMPPPSPQKQNGSGPYQTSQRPPDSFTNNRELPSLGTSSHRPGSALSISSLIAGMNDSRTQPQNSPPLQTAASPTTRTMQPPSPRQAPSTGARNDYGMYSRPRTPERYAPPTSARPPEPRYGVSSPTRSNAMTHASPEHQRQGYPGPGPQYKPMQYPDQRYYPGQSIPPRDVGMNGGPGAPPRPSSQPSQGSNLDQERKAPIESSGYGRNSYGYPPDDRRYDPQALRSGPPEQVDDRQRDRPVTVQPVTHSAYSPPREQAGPGQQQPLYPGSRNPLYRPGLDGGRREVPRSEVTSAARPPFGAPLQQPPQQPPMNIEDPSRPHNFPPRLSDPFNNMPPTSDPTAHDRRLVEQVGHSGSSSAPPYQARGPPFDPQNQRSFHLGPDANRRTGRASPLPQAVQGASAQPVGPGGRPEIKSEFGRMFSGLGGGLGSAPSRNGTATPSRQSPLPQNGSEPGFGDGEHPMARFGSQSGRRNKRVKDEDVMMIDHYSADGRSTPTISRGGKRSKHHHPPAHHHHHPAPGHHHHIHHKGLNDHDDLQGPGMHGGQFNTIRLGTNGGGPIDAAPDGNHTHHHHHIAHAGHHHHTPRPIPPPEKLPESIYNTAAVLAEAENYKRDHLGSQVYMPIAVPPSAETPLDDKFGISSMTNPLSDRIQGKVNCTYVIRIPRYFLTSQQRELVVKGRCVWGREIYRDDTDPLAAAIHSGWILGSWGEDVSDVAVVDERCGRAAEPDTLDEIQERPAAPMIPPAETDLQLTLLILPPLEQYPGYNQYGMTSRRGGDKYGGMSYKILSLRWVNEGPQVRGQERSGEARSKRLSAAQALLEMCLSTRPNEGARNGPGITA